MDQERGKSAPMRTPDDPERVARLHAEVWWNARVAPPRPRARVRRLLYVILLGWRFPDPDLRR